MSTALEINKIMAIKVKSLGLQINKRILSIPIIIISDIMPLKTC
jgi:hypothetical protein